MQEYSTRTRETLVSISENTKPRIRVVVHSIDLPEDKEKLVDKTYTDFIDELNRIILEKAPF